MLKLCLALLIASTAVLSQPIPPAPIETVWEGMFAPPYVQSPQMVLSAACVSENSCYLGGGSNGVGFGVYQYNGKMEGQITGPMNEPNMSMMVMDLAVGGTETNPTGGFSAIVDFTIGAGLQYLANKGTEWLPSAMPTEIVWASQSIARSNDGQTYVAVGNGFTNDLMISTNGALNYYNQNINYKAEDNCSYPAYIATPNSKAWFMTWGAEPAQHHKGGGGGSGSGSSSTSGSGSSSSFNAASNGEVEVNAKYYNTKTEKIVGSKANGRVLVIKNIATGKTRVVTKTAFEHRDDQLRASASDNKCNYYYGAILKSTDQGKTWTKVYENKNAMTSFLQCFDEESCTVTAFNAAESYTIVTNDGANFKITYTTPPASSTMAISLGNIGYASKTEVWAAGSKETQTSGDGMFWSSKDGGNTWTQYPHYIPDVMVIMAVDFVNGVGFAVGMTMFKTTQIMRYKKQADYGSFIQAQCPVAGCTFLCQNATWPQGVCIPASGGSVKVFCQNNELLQYAYQTTSCVGSYTTSSAPLNKCLNGTSNFYENYCPNGSGSFSESNSHKATKKDRFIH